MVSRRKTRCYLRIKPVKGLQECARIRASLPLLKVLLRRVLLFPLRKSRIIAKGRDRRKGMIGKRWGKDLQGIIFDVARGSSPVCFNSFNASRSTIQLSAKSAVAFSVWSFNLYRQTFHFSKLIFRQILQIYLNKYLTIEHAREDLQVGDLKEIYRASVDMIS